MSLGVSFERCDGGEPIAVNLAEVPL
jgi:hypothetical protein